MAKETVTTMFWRDKPVEKLTKEELIAALRECYALYRSTTTPVRTTKEMADFVKAAVGLQEAINSGEVFSRGGKYVSIPFGVADRAMEEFYKCSEALKQSIEAS